MNSENPQERDFHINSIGVRMINIKPGEFIMGAAKDDEDAFVDEKPAHNVKITYGYEISSTEITNKQYELFDPSHVKLRGDGTVTGFSVHDNEAVVNVSRIDALRFCKWLSEKEGKNYRLPSEAEWEYACRANTKTKYHTGNTLPEEYLKEQRLVKKWNARKFYKRHSLEVGQTAANPWKIHDMHGNVENWCMDRFNYYTNSTEKNPIALHGTTTDGNSFVTRGGSFGVKTMHLRSSRRLGALESERNWIIGFRVVCAPSLETINLKYGNDLERDHLKSLCFSDVIQEKNDWNQQKNEMETKPIYKQPIPYLIESREKDRFFIRPHNHCPAITWCDNGDLLTIWFSTIGEHDRDMYILGSRLRCGKDIYDPASLFFRVPGRNTTGSALLNDGKGTLYHFNGVDVATSWKTLSLIMRRSKDNGASWTEPEYVEKKHQRRNQVISGTFLNKNGEIIQLCDATPHGSGGTAFWLGKKRGTSWKDLGRDELGKLRKKPRFKKGRKGSWIAGIHAKAAQLDGGSYIAFGRSNNIRKGWRMRMPKSISYDGGKTWNYYPSVFPPITYGQRSVLLKLREGPLFLASFTDTILSSGKKMYKVLRGMDLPIHNGTIKKCYGIFGAISYDGGESWPTRRFIYLSKDKESKLEDGFGIHRKLIIDENHGELKGYLAGVQSPDGLIHLISSRMHYRFNLKWLIEFKK
ncbi:MAG: SUMF1/EgtB/PvdO family nonheme iron enzyme [Candidatus Lokiarchaeota archaeon]|nr:SUMF1/EgtB/PvdO family nonheme iron enzyme [Candidatus Lokiarchaeota archaeon]